MSVEDKMKKIIAEKLSVGMEEIVPEASFVDEEFIYEVIEELAVRMFRVGGF